jgi:hypothetical protein
MWRRENSWPHWDSNSDPSVVQPVASRYTDWAIPAPNLSVQFTIFLIGIVGGGVQLGPLGTAATNRPIVPAQGDCDDGEIGGMMIGKGNRSTRRKPAPLPLCPLQTSHAARTRTRAATVEARDLPLKLRHSRTVYFNLCAARTVCS